MSYSNRQEFEEVWATQVGHFSMGLGGIEWATDMLLEAVGHTVDPQAKFCQQLELLRVSSARFKPHLQDQILGLIDEAHALRQKRNSILHSDVAFDVYYEDVDPDIVLTPEEMERGKLLVKSQINDRQRKFSNIDLPTMIGLATEAKRINGEFWRILIAQHFSGDRRARNE